MAKKYTAQCACGAIKFEFNTDPTFIAVCHCLDCKKSTGGEAATFFGVPEDDFTLISGKPKAFHYIAQSGKGLDRNFCLDCGARVFISNLDSFPRTVFVTLGSLDNPQAIEPMLEMFTKRRLAWAKPLDLPSLKTCRPARPSTVWSQPWVPTPVAALRQLTLEIHRQERQARL